MLRELHQKKIGKTHPAYKFFYDALGFRLNRYVACPDRPFRVHTYVTVYIE